jgi:membrane protease YdiL (CAAX protease family)
MRAHSQELRERVLRAVDLGLAGALKRLKGFPLMESISQTASEPQRGFGFVRRHPLFYYFFLAYAISWLGWLPSVLAQNGLGLLPMRLPSAAIAAGALGPIVAGFLLTAMRSGKAGLRQLLRRFILWRMGVGWYGVALCGFPLLLWLGVLVVVPGAWTAFRPSALLSYVPLLVFQLFISALFEEPGWRGFALPHLQEAYGALKGTLILGVCWGCWHFPLFLIPGYGGAGTGFFGVGIPFAEFLGSIMAATIIITWVFNHTRGSLLIAMLLHASNDAFPLPSLFPHLNISNQKHLAMLFSFSVLALVILATSRGQLGYQSYWALKLEQRATGKDQR